MKTAIKRPLIHYFIIAGYVIAPAINLFFYSRNYHLDLRVLFQNFFTIFSPLSGFLLLTEPLVGLGLFFVHRFSWYAFVVHSALLILDSVIKLIAGGNLYQWSVLGGTVVWVAVIAYVIQKDFRAPYFQALPRTWREKRRVPIHHYIWLAGEQKEIGDFSASGCFVNDASLQLRLGERVPIRLNLENKDIDFTCDGEVVRITDTGLGIRFVDVPRRDQWRLNRFFRNKFPLRYAVSLSCIWQGASAVAAIVKTVDISRDGCFVATETSKFNVGENGMLQLRLGEEDYLIEATVIWINHGRFIKPLGVGFRFKSPQRRLMRRLHLLHPELPLTR